MMGQLRRTEVVFGITPALSFVVQVPLRAVLEWVVPVSCRTIWLLHLHKEKGE